MGDCDLPLFSLNNEKSLLTQTSEKSVYGVSELTSAIRAVIEPGFRDVWVEGELSNFKRAASGHYYFSLKDEFSSLSAAYFCRGKTNPILKTLEDGVKVLCRGKVTLYPPRGSYQLVVEKIEPIGAGALQLLFERLKEKLQKEGLFDSSRKKNLPSYPKKISIITSPTGAAIRDIMSVLKRRAPQIEVEVVPALVQGDEAADQLIDGIDFINRSDSSDIIVLTRGGGSAEDLSCFNDESLARKISQSQIPVVSAVGHEIDFTISDFVADLRAPTPSAAAEMITGEWVESLSLLQELKNRLFEKIQSILREKKLELKYYSSKVIHPKNHLQFQVQRCDELQIRLNQAIENDLQRRNSLLKQFMGKCEALSPLKVLDRGYTIVQTTDSKRSVIKSVRKTKKGQKLSIRFFDGQKEVEVI